MNIHYWIVGTLVSVYNLQNTIQHTLVNHTGNIRQDSSRDEENETRKILMFFELSETAENQIKAVISFSN